MENSIWGDLRSNSPAIFLLVQHQHLLILPKFSSIFPLLLLLLLLQSHLLQNYIMYSSLFSSSPQDHKMEKDGFHSLPPPKRHHLLLLFQTHLLSLRKNEPIPARKRPLPPPPPTVFLRRSALGSPPSLLPSRRLLRGRIRGSPAKETAPATAALPDLNEVEAPDEDHPVLEKAEEATGGVEEEEEDGIVCCICSSTDGDPSDPIFFCDGCGLTVHATCYGDPLVRAVQDGDWFCRRCDLPQEDGEKNVSTDCFLCPTKGGATKPADGHI